MNACCENAANLYRKENDPEERPGLTILRCKVCGCRHFQVEIDPVKMGLKFGD